MIKKFNLRANIALGLVLAFLVNCFGPLPLTQAQELVLPAPGQMVALSPAFSPVVLKGIKLDPKNPFRFHFYVDRGDSRFNQDELKNESAKLIKYFLASLTIPEKDLWVNLSPYEKDRIVPPEFGQTEMGQGLLAEDYILKQISSSLIYPESQLGREFWTKVYAQAKTQYRTTNIPVNTFNKVWIVPDKAVVYEKGGVAFVLENHLKVMLEEDYLSLQKHNVEPMGKGTAPFNRLAVRNGAASIGANIIREIVIPALTKEVNSGKNFAQLRQVFYSLILATWYKEKIKGSILNQVYSDQNKIQGLTPTWGHVPMTKGQGYVSPSRLPSDLAMNVKASQGNPQSDVEYIYQRYLQAFKKGVYNYIKEDPDPMTGERIPRKYFSGGVRAAETQAMSVVGRMGTAQALALKPGQITDIDVFINLRINRAMKGQPSPERQISEKYLRFLEKNPDEKKLGTGIPFDPERIKSQIIQIEKALDKIRGKDQKDKISPEDKAKAIVADIKKRPSLFLGEEIDIYSGVRPADRIIGRLDRGIAHRYGYAHVTLNAVLILPGGKSFVAQMKTDPTYVKMFGGHPYAGESYKNALIRELLEEVGVDWSNDPPSYVGMASYDNAKNKEKQLWFRKVLTPKDYLAMQKYQNQIHRMAGVTDGMNLRLQRKKLMKLNAKEKNGTGEILHLVKISFAQTQNGVESVDAFGEHSYLFPGVFEYKDEKGQVKSTGVTSSAKLFNLLSEPNRDLWKRLQNGNKVTSLKPRENRAMLNRLSMETSLRDINSIIATLQKDPEHYGELLRQEISLSKVTGKLKSLHSVDYIRQKDVEALSLIHQMDASFSGGAAAYPPVNSLLGLLIKYYSPTDDEGKRAINVESFNSKDIIRTATSSVDLLGYALFENNELKTPTQEEAQGMVLQLVDQLKKEIGLVNYDIHQPDARLLWDRAIAGAKVKELGGMPQWLGVLGQVLRRQNGRFQDFLITNRELTREAKETIILKVLVSAKQGQSAAKIISDVFNVWIPGFKRSEAIYGVLGSGGWEAEVHKFERNTFKSGLGYVYDTILGMPVDRNVKQEDHIEYVGRPALSWEIQNEKISALAKLGFLPLTDDKGRKIYNDLQYNGIVPEVLLSDIKDDQLALRKIEKERWYDHYSGGHTFGYVPAESEYIDFTKILLLVSAQRLETWRDMHSRLVLRRAQPVDLPKTRYGLSSKPGAGRLQYPRGDVSSFPYSDFKAQDHLMQVLHGLMIHYLMLKHDRISGIPREELPLVRSLAGLFEQFTQGTDAILKKYGHDRRELGLHFLSNDWGGKVIDAKRHMMEKILALRNTPLEKDMRKHVKDILLQADKLLTAAANKAMSNGPGAVKVHEPKTGGIDFNPAQMSLHVKNEGEGFKFDFNGSPADFAQTTGATFTIRQMTPVTSWAQILQS